MTALSTVTASIGSPITDLDGELVPAGGPDTAEVSASSNMLFVAKNGGAESTTITIATTGTVKGLAIADFSSTVAAGDYLIVPLGMVFRGSTGRASITYSATTSVTVGVVRLEA